MIYESQKQNAMSDLVYPDYVLSFSFLQQLEYSLLASMCNKPDGHCSIESTIFY
jgi:hypothetical protein